MPYSKNPIRVCGNCNQYFHAISNTSFCDSCRYVTKICKWCGKEFTVHRSHNHVEHCSVICGCAWRWRNVIQDRANRRTPCANCGKPITRKGMNSGKRKAEHLFCNTKCAGEWRSKNISGDFHPRYKGGYKGYYGKSWRKQRAAALARDLVCQRCGKTPAQNGKALDVHHIIPFERFGIEREQDAHALDNLICYCKSCHQLIEWENSRTA